MYYLSLLNLLLQVSNGLIIGLKVKWGGHVGRKRGRGREGEGRRGSERERERERERDGEGGWHTLIIHVTWKEGGWRFSS